MRKMFDGWALRVAKGRSRSLPVVGSSQRKTELEGARQILTADAFSCIPRRQLGLCCFRMPLVGPFPRMRLCQSGLKLACHTRDVCRTDYPSRLISQERRIILIVITSETERETRTPSKGFVSRGPTNFASSGGKSMGCKRVLSFSLCPPNLSYLLWSLFGSMAKRGLFLPRDTVFNYHTLAESPQEYDRATQTETAPRRALGRQSSCKRSLPSQKEIG